ncbi:MAG: ATP-binding protein [Desulfuromonadaceae bacterium]
MSIDRKLDFIIGEDINLVQLLDASEALMLLDGAVRGGACGAVVADSNGLLLAARGSESPFTETRTILVEGEPSGTVSVYMATSGAALEGIADMLHAALQTLINGAMRRMLTAEAHTTIVNHSYEELLETNRKLGASELQYRELAASLEIKVRERTEELNRAYAIMLQKEKLAAIGGLAAGMAHEINNPIGFVISNLHTLTKYAAKLKEMLEFYRTSCEPVIPEHIARQVESRWRELKLGFVLTDIDGLVIQSLSGAERVQKLVANMKGFSHVDEAGEVFADINLELEQTLNVLHHEIRQDIAIELNFATLPKARLNPALLSQAFFQILHNAIHLKTQELKISVTTCQLDNDLVIKIADNGPGIPFDIRDRIFEPFFTTKDVGQGTGMGLTLAQQSIQALGGTIAVTSPPEGGTAFIVSIPVGGQNL